ncbi:RNA helicase-like protein [Colletotrichum tofieldiae]|nr:RNA helicase-like protein [Colletotrichum tofieldiae]
MPAEERSGERRDEERRHRRTRSRSVTRTRSRSRSPRRHQDETRRRSPIGEGGSRRERRRSPRREDRDRESRHHHRHRHHHHRHRGDNDKDRSSKPATAAVVESLPYEARQLSKSELGVFRPLLAYYLDLQKQKDIRDMDEREVRGRWKSFVGKWNRGELSQGWYDPEMFVAAKERALEEGIDGPRDEGRRDGNEVVKDERRERGGDERGEGDEEEDDDDDDEDLGPRLPPTAREGGQRSGPGIPSMADLSLHRETLAEEAQREREARIADLRMQRKDDRKLQRERLDDVAPALKPGRARDSWRRRLW